MAERCSTCELRDKEVINLCDGRRLGYISDFELELCSGRITAICVPGEMGCFGFKKGEEIVIPWENIQRIGEDAILVEVPPLPNPPDCGCTSGNEGHARPRKKKGGFFF